MTDTARGIEGCEPSEYEREVAEHVKKEMRSWGEDTLSVGDVDWIIDAALHKMSLDIRRGRQVPVAYIGTIWREEEGVSFTYQPSLLKATFVEDFACSS